MIKAIAFDLDGVIADLVEAHYIALNEALAVCGFPTITREDQDSKYNGLPTKVKLQLLGISDPADVQLIYKAKQDLTMKAIGDTISEDVKLVNMANALDWLGYRLCLASNSIRQTVDLVAQRTGLKPYFEFTLSNEDVQNAKPHPEIYLKAAEKFGIRPWEMLVVEDSPHGQRACLEAGGRLCAVKDTHDVTLDKIISSIDEHNKAEEM